jgi:hypothetical protein
MAWNPPRMARKFSGPTAIIVESPTAEPIE